MMPNRAVSMNAPVPAPSRGERGSAFTVALLVLVVLTIAGLVLTLITQTEARIGGNERTTNRALYAADSGVQVSTVRTLWLGADTQQTTFYLNTTQQDTGTAAVTTFSDQVTVTPLIPLAWIPSPLGQINQNAQSYYDVTYIVNSTSNRVGVDGATSQTVATKTIGAMIRDFSSQSTGAQLNPTVTTSNLLF
jgi:Tfp pilus assembly protein PilX